MIAFSTLSNLCSQAMRATLVGLPAARSRLYMAITGGLHRTAEIVAWNSAVRTSARPALIRRLPLCEPESCATGATPTNAAIAFSESVPSSGSRTTQDRVDPAVQILLQRGDLLVNKFDHPRDQLL